VSDDDRVLGEVIDRVGRAPDRAALFVDFDGSLAPIVPRPPDARPLPAAVEALGRLVGRGLLVAVVSGRPLAFLERWFPPGVRLAGLYGLERRVDGVESGHPEAQRWAPVVAGAVERARRELPAGVLVEDKGLSLTLHFRAHPDLGDRVTGWAELAGAALGLEPRAAKMSMELHPPVHIDKGEVVAAWAGAADTVVFAGDDAGDLPAFAALARLRAEGRQTLAVAVVGPEAPPAVLAAADVAVAGPPGLAGLLARLADAAD
jgi:trehalose 6-phosphate phosphatase